MKPDPTYKDIFAHAFMVEELMRWLVADLHGARSLATWWLTPCGSGLTI